MAASEGDQFSRLLAFLSAGFAKVDREAPVKLEIVYCPSAGYREETLRTWTPTSDAHLFGATDGEDVGPQVHVTALTHEIIDHARHYADGFGGGRHRFKVRITQAFGEREVEPLVVLPGYSGPAAEDETALQAGGGVPGVPGELPATSAGTLAQVMRHLENRERAQLQRDQMFMQAVAGMASTLREENTELREQLKAASDARLAMIDKIEAAEAKDHERQIEALQVTEKERRKTALASKMGALLPVVGSQILRSLKKGDGVQGASASGGALKSGPTPLAETLGQLFVTMTEQTRSVLIGSLGMEQQVLLFEIVGVVQEGDSPLLATMVHDLASGMSEAQLAQVLGALDDRGRALFVRAIQIANVATSPKRPSAPPASAADPGAINGHANDKDATS